RARGRAWPRRALSDRLRSTWLALAAPDLRGGGLLGCERSVLHGAGALVRRDDHAVVRRLDIGACESRRDGAVREETLPAAKRDWEDHEVELIHQVVLQERLDQPPAAVYLDLRPRLLLEVGYVGSNVALDESGVVPVRAAQGRRGHVLACAVQGVGAGRCRARPICSEDLVGLPPEQHVERASHELGHLLAQAVIPVLHRPAAVGESAAWVFLRTARRLHHAFANGDERTPSAPHTNTSGAPCPMVSYAIRVPSADVTNLVAMTLLPCCRILARNGARPPHPVCQHRRD